ncbi:hypothetical protein HB991_07080 [Yersinia mollaretii]|uniref:Uncharacterized protein n=1 Tax=Yersinia mollaretii TaxID=33060 RepID=A0AA44CKC9_YERMO|nr:hypothetical protein [Yersinia mollaretii]NIL22278.1 hypothetical protein [Yersinia mollaretii]
MVKIIPCMYEKRLSLMVLYLVGKSAHLSENELDILISKVMNGDSVEGNLLNLVNDKGGLTNNFPEKKLEFFKIQAKDTLIPEGELAWFNNPRALSYVFDMLHFEYRMLYNKEVNFFDVVLPVGVFKENEDRIIHEAALRLIDRLCAASNKQHIQLLLNERKQVWERIQSKFKNPFWFPSDRYSSHYDSDYRWLLSYFEKIKITEKSVDIYKKNLPHLVIFSLFDRWVSKHTDSEVELFIIKLKKAWGQKKFRDGVKDKKVLNTYIGKESKKQLDYLVRKNKRKINEELEVLIHDAYMKAIIKY